VTSTLTHCTGGHPHGGQDGRSQGTHSQRILFPVLALVILIALLAAAFFWPSWKFQRPNYVLAIVIAVMLLIVMRSSVSDRWSWMLGLLPTLLVSYQAFYLWLSQPKEVEGARN
jgi:MFS superfamily sulfate permease-like transporter